MRISEKKATACYEAIDKPIRDLRVKVYSGELSLEQIEKMLSDVQSEIWRGVIKELNLETIA